MKMRYDVAIAVLALAGGIAIGWLAGDKESRKRDQAAEEVLVAQYNLVYFNYLLANLRAIQGHVNETMPAEMRQAIDVVTADTLLWNGLFFDTIANQDGVVDGRSEFSIELMTKLVKLLNERGYKLPAHTPSKDYTGPPHPFIPAGFNTKKYLTSILDGSHTWTSARDLAEEARMEEQNKRLRQIFLKHKSKAQQASSDAPTPKPGENEPTTK